MSGNIQKRLKKIDESRQNKIKLLVEQIRNDFLIPFSKKYKAKITFPNFNHMSIEVGSIRLKTADDCRREKFAEAEKLFDIMCLNISNDSECMLCDYSTPVVYDAS